MWLSAIGARLMKKEITLLTQIAKSVERSKRNPFGDLEDASIKKEADEEEKVIQVKPHDDGDLREKDDEDDTIGHEEREGVRGFSSVFTFESHSSSGRSKAKPHVVDGETESHARVPHLEEKEAEEAVTTGEEMTESERSRGKYNDYCDKYEQHFSFYCVGDVDRGGEHEKILSKFCPTYKKVCPNKQITLWYNGCPKYAQYHYASQYIYSKAEKGKTIPGLATNTNQYNIPIVPPSGATAGVPTSKKLHSDEAINSLTSDLTNTYRDPASVLSRAHQVRTFPVVPSDSAFGAADSFKVKLSFLQKTTIEVSKITVVKFDGLTDSAGVLHRPRSRSPFTKPGLWEPNPDNPHNRDHSNKFYYYPSSVSADWLNGQIAWGAHWAVPASGVGGTDGFSTLHFPTIGTFLNIPDDYD
uniref:Transmembrane protein n=1 Tax=Angiostrongylus cantonensis TaxID=6313 RepID=A0A0K0DJJ8_ANGCA